MRVEILKKFRLPAICGGLWWGEGERITRAGRGWAAADRRIADGGNGGSRPAGV